MQIHLQNVNPNKVHDELIAAGVEPVVVENDLEEGQYIAANTWITVPEGTDMGVVQAVIDNHDPTPLPPPLTELQKLQKDHVDLVFALMLGGVL